MEMTYEDLPFPCSGSGLVRSSYSDTGLLHMTNVIHSIERHIGREYKGEGFQDFGMTGEMGFMWEDALTLVMADRMREVQRPEEVVRDGIVCSPDGVGPDPLHLVHLVLEEYKLTWKSNRNLPTEVWYWMTQCKGYCYVLGLDTAIMRIGYIMGNYKGSGPLYREARITFTEQELRDNWNMITSHAAEMQKERT